MTTVVIRHKVGDFATWLKGHQERVEIFSKVASGFETFQDTNDPNSIVLVLHVTDLDGLMALKDDPEVMGKLAHEKHTVIMPIIISMPVAV